MISQLLHVAWLLAVQAPPSEPAIVVKIMEPKQQTLADVVMSAVGLTGILVAIAVVLAVAVAGVLFFVRSRNPLRNASEGAEHQL